MIISPFIAQPSVQFDETQYTTDPEYIQCLARVVRTVTSDALDHNDDSIPLAIRVSAQNPHHNDDADAESDVTELHSIYTNNLRDYLDHASAIIPATNGAFWAVFPFSRGLHANADSAEDSCQQSVWYYPPDAKTESDGIYAGGLDDGCLITNPRDFQKGDGDPTIIAPIDSLRKSHPCGATYTNIRVPIEYDTDVLAKLNFRATQDFSSDIREFLWQFAPWEPRSTGDDHGEKMYVDVLVCCGGYYWDAIPKGKDKPPFRLSNTLRLFVPTTSVGADYSLTNEIIRSTSDSTRRLVQTIVCGTRLYNALGFPLGSTVIALKSRPHTVLVGGGVLVEAQYSEEKSDERGWFKRSPQPKYDHLYPAIRIPIRASVQEFDVKIGDKKVRGIFRIVADMSPTFYSIHSLKENMAINIATTDLLNDGDVKLERNVMPVLYPTLIEVGKEVISYGGEFIDHDPPQVPPDPDWDWPAADAKSPILGLCHLYHAMIDETEKEAMFNVALLSCQYVRIRHSYPYNGIIWKPLNIGGAHGLAEGAVPIPYPDERKVVLVGGIESTASNVCGGYQCVGSAGKNFAHNLRKKEDIRDFAGLTYDPHNVKTIPLYSKIIPLASTDTVPRSFELGIDTLKYDCLHSPAIQLGTSDYFVIPHSMIKYKYPSPDYFTNATLIRRRKTDSLSPEELENDNIRKHWDANARMFVSEVIGMPVRYIGETIGEETPYYYAVSRPARGSIGSVTVSENKEYWIYELGYGSEPAKYYHIEIVTTAKSLLPHDGREGYTSLDAGNPNVIFGNTLPYPSEWSGGSA